MAHSWESSLGVVGWGSSFPSVDRFLKHYGRATRSEHTRKNVLIVLSQLCRSAGLDPGKLVALSPEKASETLQSFLDGKCGEGDSIRTLNVALGYLKVFFRVNGFKNGRELEVERYHQPARYRKRSEYVPTRDEILRMSYADGTKIGRAMILAAYTSGLRNSTLRALRYRDVRMELEKGFPIVKVPVYPEMKEVDPGACKGNIPYYTFFANEAVSTIREYLEERVAVYGDVGDDEPLFCSTSTNYAAESRRRTPVKIRTLEVVVTRAARKAGLQEWRQVVPHCLRKAFESALRNNGIDPKDQEFLMGHILPGSQDTYYDKTKTEDLRAKYARVRFFSSEEFDKVEMIKAFAKTLGVDEIEVKVTRMRKAQPALTEEEAVGRVVREEFMRPMRDEVTRQIDEDRGSQIVVSEASLESYLKDGWQFASLLPSGRIVIRK